jgi:hypothetical protein
MKGRIRILGAIVFSMLTAGPMLCAAGTAFLVPSGQDEAKKAGAEKDKIPEIGTVTITQSGVGRRNKVTVIRYRKSDLAVVGVTENGQDIPPGRFERYQEELLKALDYPRMRDLVDRFEETKKYLKNMDPLDRKKRLELDKLLDELSAFLSKASPGRKAGLDPQVRRLSNRVFETAVLALVRGRKIVSPGDEVRLVMRRSECELNGRALPPDLSEEILRLWEKTQGAALKAGERVTIIFDSEKDAGNH